MGLPYDLSMFLLPNRTIPALIVTIVFISALSLSKAAPSPHCVEETQAIFQTVQVKEELDALGAKLQEYFSIETFDNVCNVAQNDGTDIITCIGEFDEFSPDIQAACKNAGGQFAEVDYFLECSGSERSFSHDFTHVAGCVGMSCDVPNNLNVFFFKSTEKSLEDIGYACNSNVSLRSTEEGTSGADSLDSLGILLVAIITTLLSFLVLD